MFLVAACSRSSTIPQAPANPSTLEPVGAFVPRQPPNFHTRYSLAAVENSGLCRSVPTGAMRYTSFPSGGGGGEIAPGFFYRNAVLVGATIAIVASRFAYLPQRGFAVDVGTPLSTCSSRAFRASLVGVQLSAAMRRIYRARMRAEAITPAPRVRLAGFVLGTAPDHREERWPDAGGDAHSSANPSGACATSTPSGPITCGSREHFIRRLLPRLRVPAVSFRADCSLCLVYFLIAAGSDDGLLPLWAPLQRCGRVGLDRARPLYVARRVKLTHLLAVFAPRLSRASNLALRASGWRRQRCRVGPARR